MTIAHPHPHAPVAIIRDDAEALEVARQVADLFRPGAAERDRERRLPLDELELFSRTGLWGISVPREFGGAGVSRVTLARVIARITAAARALRPLTQNHI